MGELHGCGLYLNIAVFMFIFTIFFAAAHNLWDLSFPARYRTPCPLRRKLGVLTSGPSGKPLSTVVFKVFPGGPEFGILRFQRRTVQVLYPTSCVI